MRRSSRKMWWVVPCTSRKSLRTESGLDIEEILKMKLATIIEEPEVCEDNESTVTNHRFMDKKGKKIQLKVKIGSLFKPQFSLKDSYVLFMTGFASKGSLHGLSQY
ncbi:unnamed protein product [Ilex paraguariensis]|uniref:Uncharacterized protein n=1 Tax=Ilex paraguariensis TaxID=185542 RepID=A0ABC8R7X5_9AQUA